MASVNTLSSVPTRSLVAELEARCKCLSNPQKRLLLIGAPGSGKGTQSEWLVAEHNLTHISTGDALRETIASGSDLGKELKKIMDSGELVSDEIVLKIVEERLKKLPENSGGFILDGFPRTKAQAEGLSALLARIGQPLSGVLYFDCSAETLKFRICGRRIHPSSGRTYHVINKPPKVEGKDDVTGEDLIQRGDDNEESLQKRLATFEKNTLPLLEYYRDQHLLFEFNSNREAPFVKKEIGALFMLADAA